MIPTCCLIIGRRSATIAAFPSPATALAAYAPLAGLLAAPHASSVAALCDTARRPLEVVRVAVGAAGRPRGHPRGWHRLPVALVPAWPAPPALLRRGRSAGRDQMGARCWVSGAGESRSGPDARHPIPDTCPAYSRATWARTPGGRCESA